VDADADVPTMLDVIFAKSFRLFRDCLRQSLQSSNRQLTWHSFTSLHFSPHLAFELETFHFFCFQLGASTIHSHSIQFFGPID